MVDQINTIAYKYPACRMNNNVLFLPYWWSNWTIITTAEADKSLHSPVAHLLRFTVLELDGIYLVFGPCPRIQARGLWLLLFEATHGSEPVNGDSTNRQANQ